MAIANVGLDDPPAAVELAVRPCAHADAANSFRSRSMTISTPLRSPAPARATFCLSSDFGIGAWTIDDAHLIDLDDLLDEVLTFLGA